MDSDENDESKEACEAPNPFIVFNKDNFGANFFGKNSNDINSNKEISESMENLNINDKPKRIILKPRGYQKKIYEKAKGQNSII